MTPEAWMRSLEVQFKPAGKPYRLHILQMAVDLRGPLAPSLAYDYNKEKWYRCIYGRWVRTNEESVTETITYMLQVRFPDRWCTTNLKAFMGLLRSELSCNGFSIAGPNYTPIYT